MSCLAELLERHGGVKMEGETTPFVRRDEYCSTVTFSMHPNFQTVVEHVKTCEGMCNM